MFMFQVYKKRVREYVINNVVSIYWSIYISASHAFDLINLETCKKFFL